LTGSYIHVLKDRLTKTELAETEQEKPRVCSLIQLILSNCLQAAVLPGC
jgi:hypothetical protein